MKTILIELDGGRKEIRAQVSDKATVTFGGLIPGAKVDGGSNRTALRIYEGKTQLAVFTGVTNFRFVDSVTVLEKRIQQASKNIMSEENGIQKAKTVNVTTEEWVNPDLAQPVKQDAGGLFKTLQLEAGD